MNDIRIAWYRPTKRLERGQFWLTESIYVYVVILQTFDGWVWEGETANGHSLARSKKPLATRDNAERNLMRWASDYRETQRQYVGKGRTS